MEAALQQRWQPGHELCVIAIYKRLQHFQEQADNLEAEKEGPNGPMSYYWLQAAAAAAAARLRDTQHTTIHV